MRRQSIHLLQSMIVLIEDKKSCILESLLIVRTCTEGVTKTLGQCNLHASHWNFRGDINCIMYFWAKKTWSTGCGISKLRHINVHHLIFEVVHKIGQCLAIKSFENLWSIPRRKREMRLLKARSKKNTLVESPVTTEALPDLASSVKEEKSLPTSCSLYEPEPEPNSELLYCPENQSPPENLSNEIHNISLHVWFDSADKDDDRPYWFCINPFQGKSREIDAKDVDFPKLSPTRIHEERDGFGLVACGSILYSFGGVASADYWGFVGKDDIWMYDTKSLEPAWTKHPTCPKMPQPRSFPVAVAVSDKIYLFGSNLLDTPKPNPWAEVFDTESGNWSEVPSVPKDIINLGYINGVAVRKDEIFIMSGKNLFSYNVRTQTWEHINEYSFDPKTNFWTSGNLLHPDFPPIYGENVIVDNICYVYKSAGFVAAYDLGNKKCMILDILGDLKTQYMVRYPGSGSVLHLRNGLLCLLCTVKHTPNNRAYLICVAFHIFRDKPTLEGNLDLRSEIISIQSYFVHGYALGQSFAL